MGASFLSQTVALQDSTTVKFEIWDTAGQERYCGQKILSVLKKNIKCSQTHPDTISTL